jgi:hypothetical protein
VFASMLWRCLLTAAGCWIVAAIADGVRMDGSVGGQVLASLLVGVTFQLPALLQKLLERAGKPRSCLAAVVFVAANLVLWLPGSVLALWVSVLICEAIDLPLRVAGFSSIVFGTVAILYCSAVLHTPVVLARRRAEGGFGIMARMLASLLVLWLMLGLDGVRLDEGPAWQQVLTVVMLAPLFHFINIRLLMNVPRHTAVRLLPAIVGYSLVANAFALWVVSWISAAALKMPLSVTGIGTFVVSSSIATAIMWAVNLPGLLGVLRSRGQVLVRVSRFGYLPPGPKERAEERRSAAARQLEDRHHQVMLGDVLLPRYWP